jgi:hypothetical protein
MLAMIHLGCQELLYNKDESSTLSYNKYICSVNNKSDLEKIKEELLKTKYFGCGTYYLMLIVVLVYYAQS